MKLALLYSICITVHCLIISSSKSVPKSTATALISELQITLLNVIYLAAISGKDLQLVLLFAIAPKIVMDWMIISVFEEELELYVLFTDAHTMLWFLTFGPKILLPTQPK